LTGANLAQPNFRPRNRTQEVIEELMKLAKEHRSYHFVIAVWRAKEAESAA
jgi:hypothetical protein